MTTETRAPRVSYTPPKLRQAKKNHLWIESIQAYAEVSASTLDDLRGRGYSVKEATPSRESKSVTLVFWEVTKP